MKAISIFIALFLMAGGFVSCGKEVKDLKEETRLLKEENNFLKAENVGLKKEIEELYKKLDEKIDAGTEGAKQKAEAKEAVKAKGSAKTEEGVNNKPR